MTICSYALRVARSSESMAFPIVRSLADRVNSCHRKPSRFHRCSGRSGSDNGAAAFRVNRQRSFAEMRGGLQLLPHFEGAGPMTKCRVPPAWICSHVRIGMSSAFPFKVAD